MLSAPGRARRYWAWLDGMLRPRCDVCGQPLGAHGYYVCEEPEAIVALEAPDPPREWTLCRECSEAVSRRVERMTLPTPRRLRVAVGLVASERSTPEAIRARAPDAAREQRADRRSVRLLIWIFAIFFVVHALAFVVVMVVVAPH